MSPQESPQGRLSRRLSRSGSARGRLLVIWLALHWVRPLAMELRSCPRMVFQPASCSALGWVWRLESRWVWRLESRWVWRLESRWVWRLESRWVWRLESRWVSCLVMRLVSQLVSPLQGSESA